MPRTYVLCMLLEHGELTWREIQEVTRWSKDMVGCMLRRCIEYGWIRRRSVRGVRGYLYELA